MFLSYVICCTTNTTCGQALTGVLRGRSFSSAATVRPNYVLPSCCMLRHDPAQHPPLTRAACPLSVIQFKEVFLTEHHLAIVMEFAPGGDMFQFVKASGGLKVNTSRSWGAVQVLDTLFALLGME
jgi:hypothetical protein